jgi:hypothetical protein
MNAHNVTHDGTTRKQELKIISAKAGDGMIISTEARDGITISCDNA